MPLPPYAAVVLAGGTGRRLGGVDKASLRVRGRTLLDHALDAVAGADPIVVVGPPGCAEGHARVRAGVLVVQEEPAYGGPAAGLLSGVLTLPSQAGRVLVLAVDMPGVTADTVARLLAGAAGHDGAALVDEEGRRQAAMALDVRRLREVAPDAGRWTGLSLRRLLEPLDLIGVDASAGEADDVDTPADLDRLTGG